MSAAIMETTNHIHYLEIIHREIGIEGNEQKASICNVIRHHIPNIMDDLRELNEYRKKYGKLVIESGRKSYGVGD